MLRSKYDIHVQRVMLVQCHPHVCGSDFNEAPLVPDFKIADAMAKALLCESLSKGAVGDDADILSDVLKSLDAEGADEDDGELMTDVLKGFDAEEADGAQGGIIPYVWEYESDEETKSSQKSRRMRRQRASSSWERTKSRRMRRQRAVKRVRQQ